MIESAMPYEPPALIELGDFTELTRITDKGGYVDLFGGWWLD
ncbi:hypothetical protein SAMN04489712_112130 [Thermomonospora echinospora]|uniref:Lasso RiPP family leader peptide-containing protein n=1 Tax=Thermomonospora echinospora TaxID=1992 RepID=A0A1H6D1N3_9ACTN|nr:lasso RiPP family leader peptide-containing protein [Thermomonospora echinospora]SEG78833.1 hypothetical protein SAMN04489712_112130 [Thermomonospora echinospora]